jgi:hypothetical protein
MAVLPSAFWVARGESVATLRMIDTHTEDDEGYLVVGPNNVKKGVVIVAPKSSAACR